MTLAPPPMSRVAAMVRAAIEEDAALADATVAYLELGTRDAAAVVRVSGDIVACGIPVACEVFRQIDPTCRVTPAVADGDRARAGDTLLGVRGRAASIVAAERTALNFLQRMSGIATHASRFVDAVRGTGVVILDTRKTAPLWRELDKYAVRCGGARNHRHDLGAMVLVKDNHVRALGGHQALLARVLAAPRAPFVEVEVDSLEFLADLLASPAAARIDRVMLDNFSPAAVEAAVRSVAAYRETQAGVPFEIEVSGGVTLETVAAFARPGVDFISVGALTHSAPAAPMSLEIL